MSKRTKSKQETNTWAMCRSVFMQTSSINLLQEALYKFPTDTPEMPSNQYNTICVFDGCLHHLRRGGLVELE